MLEEFKSSTGSECEVKEKVVAKYDQQRLSSLEDGYLLRSSGYIDDPLGGLR